LTDTTTTTSSRARTWVSGVAARARTLPMTQTIGYYIAFVTLGMFSASLGPTIPGLAQHTHSTLGQISYLFTARSLGYLLGSFAGGHLYDRRPGHPVMAGVLAVMATMMVFAPMIPLLWVLAAVLLVLGMGEGTLDVGGNTLLVWVHGEKVGPFMNALHFFFGLGAFISPIIVAQAVLRSGDVTVAYWALALLMVPAFIWLLRVPSPATPVAARESQVNGGVATGLLVLVVLIFYLAVGAEASFGGWISTYSLARGIGSAAAAAYMASVFWGSLMLGRLVSIPLARFKPSSVLLCDLLGCVAGASIVLLAGEAIPLIWLGSFVFGFSMASIFPTTITLAGGLMTITGRVTGWFLVGASAGGMTVPWLIGQLFEPVGPQAVMLVILADLILGLGVFGLLMLRASQHRRAMEAA
jgi:FHS family Na+ dependent glucose MFS transporter 1